MCSYFIVGNKIFWTIVHSNGEDPNSPKFLGGLLMMGGGGEGGLTDLEFFFRGEGLGKNY